MDEVPRNMPVRVGLLGYSDIARRKFIPALLQSEKARLVAVASRDRVRAAVALSGVCRSIRDYQELIASTDVDLVYISLPNHLHEEWAIRALQEGKHVLCEKPLGLCPASVNRMLDAADRHGRLLYENLMYLQHPLHKAVKSLISNGRIGQVRSLRSEFAFPGPAEGDFRLDPAMGGGAFNDMNRYPLSAALYFLEGKRHRFLQGSIDVQNGLARSLQATSITNAGEEFSFLTAFGQSYRSFYEIVAERGSIRVDRAYTTPADMEGRAFVTIDGSDESFCVTPCDHFLATIEHVCGLIRSGSWNEEHERARRLAGLAGLFHENCIRRGPAYETE